MFFCHICIQNSLITSSPPRLTKCLIACWINLSIFFHFLTTVSIHTAFHSSPVTFKSFIFCLNSLILRRSLPLSSNWSSLNLSQSSMISSILSVLVLPYFRWSRSVKLLRTHKITKMISEHPSLHLGWEAGWISEGQKVIEMGRRINI